MCSSADTVKCQEESNKRHRLLTALLCCCGVNVHTAEQAHIHDCAHLSLRPCNPGTICQAVFLGPSHAPTDNPLHYSKPIRDLTSCTLWLLNIYLGQHSSKSAIWVDGSGVRQSAR